MDKVFLKNMLQLLDLNKLKLKINAYWKYLSDNPTSAGGQVANGTFTATSDAAVIQVFATHGKPGVTAGDQPTGTARFEPSEVIYSNLDTTSKTYQVSIKGTSTGIQLTTTPVLITYRV